MRKRNGHGKIKIILSVVFLAFIFVVYIILANKDKLSGLLPTAESTAEEKKSVLSCMDDMEDNEFYVESKDSSGKTVYTLAPYGNNNFTKKYDATSKGNSMWLNTGDDDEIPTVKSDTKLLFHSTSYVPTEFTWERFGDYGYSIGVSNLYYDKNGHYYLESDDNNGFKNFINPDSSATALNDYKDYGKLYLDKVGDMNVNMDSMSPSGSVLNLKKDKEYVCSFYTGTYYQDFRLKADTRIFSHLEDYTTYGYSFLHSNCIEVTIPKWLKSGYYLINNYGFIRYVSADDESLYNGEAYNDSIDWNDTLIKYDDNGQVSYDPTNDNGDVSDKYTGKNSTSSSLSSSNTSSDNISSSNSADSYSYDSTTGDTGTGSLADDTGDAGLDDSEYDGNIPEDATTDSGD